MHPPVQTIMFRPNLPFVFLLLASFAGGTLQAATIHKWVDDKGVTHYSDEPPQQSLNPVIQMPIVTGAITSGSADKTKNEHYYSIANQWQRMQQESRERQQRELQRAALKRTQQSTQPTQYREVRETRYVSAYPRRYYRRHGKKSHYPSISHYGGQPASSGGQVSSGFPTTH